MGFTTDCTETEGIRYSNGYVTVVHHIQDWGATGQLWNEWAEALNVWEAGPSSDGHDL